MAIMVDLSGSTLFTGLQDGELKVETECGGAHSSGVEGAD